MSQDPAPESVAAVAAVIVTHRRPHLAGELVRTLIEVEGLPSDRIIVVVSGDGGLDDPNLESSVRMIRLESNLGPAAGFKRGIESALSDSGWEWLYLCEDDVGLMPLEPPRLGALVRRIDALRSLQPVGAVVAYGRRFSRRTGHATNLVPPDGSPQDLDVVDVAAWGATLLSRAVAEAGLEPDPEWFFAFEDFDYFCRIREAGFTVLVDSLTARRVADYETNEGRADLHSGIRPTDSDEGWRAYYVSRNYFALGAPPTDRRRGSWRTSHTRPGGYNCRRAATRGWRSSTGS